MSERPKISQEELDREYEWMDSRKKHSYNHRMINRKMRNRRIVKIAIIVFLVISVLATIFILVFHRYYQSENVSKSGAYAITLDNIENKNIHLSYFKNDKEKMFDELLGSGRTGAQSRGNSEVTSILAIASSTSAESTVFETFMNLVNLTDIEQIRINDQSVGKDNGVQYIDEDDKSYIAFYDSFYVNRFYLINDGSDDFSTDLKVTFTKVQDYEIYKTARMILAINDGKSIKYLAFAVKNDDYEGTHREVVASRESKGVGRDFLIDPNIKNENSNITIFVHYDLAFNLGNTEIYRTSFSSSFNSSNLNELYSAVKKYKENPNKELSDEQVDDILATLNEYRAGAKYSFNDLENIFDIVKCVDNPDNSWCPYEMVQVVNENEENKEISFAYTYENLLVKANDKLEITMLFIACEESDYDFKAEEMSNNEMKFNISFSKHQ